MCFVLYGGTSKPVQVKEWRNDAPDLSVAGLTERDTPIAAHFSKPIVQYIGSTSGCGCDFPNVMYQGGDWPWFDFGDHDPERESRDRYNREGLVNLLQATGEQTVELYGVWAGDFEIPPAVREEILVTAILEPSFLFKELGFYVVRLA
jgi:hypothetical protein